MESIHDEDSMQSFASASINISHHSSHKKSKKKKKKRDRSPENESELERLLRKKRHKEKRRHENELRDVEISKEGIRKKKKKRRVPLQYLLEFIHQYIERKDPHNFFAWPVTDVIAPGYSKLIAKPMDLATMRKKIVNLQYATLPDYIDDVKLMCHNAMIYNRPDTVYFKAAKKVLHTALKLSNPQKLLAMESELPFVRHISSEQLGVKEEEQPQSSEAQTNKESADVKTEPDLPKKNDLSNSKFETLDDVMSPDEILAQVQSAAREAANKLATTKPNCASGYLQKGEDGSTTLKILIPSAVLPKNIKTEKPVLLGSLVGRLNHGSSNIHGFGEDKRNIVKTVKPLNYGAFGSYAPSYDSTFANLSKEDSELIYRTYGDHDSVSYAESILNFAKDCDYAVTMVDNLLDIMTGGEHRLAMKQIEESKLSKENGEKEKEIKNTDDKSMDVDTATIPGNSLPANGDSESIDRKLVETGSLIEKLHKVQTDRLSAPLPTHLEDICPPSDAEHQLAEKVTKNLTHIIKRVPPSTIVPASGIRKAMGLPTSTLQNVENGTSGSHISPSLDLVTELGEFLENQSSLASFPLQDDDNSFEKMLTG